MASLTEALASGNQAPTQGVDVNGDLQSGLKAGVQLAQVKDQVESKKMDLENQKAELMTKQASTVNSLVTNLARANPVIGKKMLPQIREKLINLGADPDIADYTISDDQNRKRQIAIQQVLQGKLSDKDFASNYFQSAADVMGWDQAAQAYDHNQKRAMEEQKMQSQERIAGMKVDAAKASAGTRVAQNDQKIDLAATRIHNDNTKTIEKDPTLTKQLTSINNLKNAISNIESGEAPTVQSFDELQQSVRSNLGIKGTSGVTERSKTYLKQFGFSAAEAEQFLTGKPVDIQKYGGKAFLDHVKALANNEITNVSGQADSKLKEYESSHADFYSKYPGKANDYQNFMKNKRASFGINTGQPAGGNADAGPAPLPGVDPKLITPDMQAKVDAATKAGYKPEEIAAYIKQMQAQAKGK